MLLSGAEFVLRPSRDCWFSDAKPKQSFIFSVVVFYARVTFERAFSTKTSELPLHGYLLLTHAVASMAIAIGRRLSDNRKYRRYSDY